MSIEILQVCEIHCDLSSEVYLPNRYHQHNVRLEKNLEGNQYPLGVNNLH